MGRRFEKCALCSRRSQERMELLFNYIFTNPGGYLSSLRLDIAMLFFFFSQNFFFSFPLWSTKSKTIKNRVYLPYLLSKP